MDFLTQLRAKLQERIDARAALKAEIDTLLEAPAAENRDLNAAETATFTEKRSKMAVLDLKDSTDERYADSIDAIQKRVDELAAIEGRTAEIAAILPAGAQNVQVRNEARTYRPDVSHSFLADLYAHQVTRMDPAASERIQRHSQEVLAERRSQLANMPAEYRDLVVTNVAGLVPPTYLLEQFAPVARAGRPFLNSLNSLDLPPDGVSFTIPRGTTGTAAAMTAEASGWNEQDYAVTDLSLTVNLVTAQQDLSRTLFMRGGSIVDRVLFPDLMADAEVKLNVSALNGNGTAPQHRGVLNVAGISAVTYTDASPTVAEAWPKFADAIQRINSLRFLPGTAVYMHPRRWGWITAATDSSGRPLFEFSTVPPNSVMGLGKAAEYGQVVGTLQGLPVITDASIPTNLGAGTNEDIVIVARTTDFLYWEDDMLQFTFEQVLGPQQVRLAVGRFSLFTAGRYPTSISTIGGTGLITPSF